MAPLARSAGACPPRSLHGEGQALALRCQGRSYYRSAGACPPRSRGLQRLPISEIQLPLTCNFKLGHCIIC